jgi:hypothetical protein
MPVTSSSFFTGTVVVVQPRFAPAIIQKATAAAKTSNAMTRNGRFKRVGLR